MTDAADMLTESLLRRVTGEGQLDLWLQDREGRWMVFATGFRTIDAATECWLGIAGREGSFLSCFEVRRDKKVLYAGDYCSDEC